MRRRWRKSTLTCTFAYLTSQLNLDDHFQEKTLLYIYLAASSFSATNFKHGELKKILGREDLKLWGPKPTDNFTAFASPYQRFLPKFHEANDDFRFQLAAKKTGFS